MKNTENSRNLNHEVLTLEEISGFLRIPIEKLLPDVASGKLQTLKIADEVRILKTDLTRYLELAKTGSSATARTRADSTTRPLEERVPEVNLDHGKAFEHTWPNSQKERYSEAYAGSAEIDGAVRSVLIGFTERPSAGRLRNRAVVFVDGRPMVEFVGADDFDKSHKMVSLVKRRNGKRLRPGETVPGEYRNLKIEPYRKYVTGAYASSNQAVVCSKNDLNVMVEHALLRRRQIESR